MDVTGDETRAAWAIASRKYEDEYAEHLAEARSVHGLDYSEAALSSAQRRADELGMPCRYTRATMPASGLDDDCADLVYTGKGALIWLPDLPAFFAEVHRLLRPGGRFYVYEAHPMVPVWAWDADEIRVRPDRSYFAPTHVNDSFPGNGAVERQHTLSSIVMSCVRAGFEIEHLDEYPEPFWRPWGFQAAAWDGRVPNAFSLLARRA